MFRNITMLLSKGVSITVIMTLHFKSNHLVSGFASE